MKKKPYTTERRSRAAAQSWKSPTCRRMRITSMKAYWEKVRAALAAQKGEQS